MRTFVDYLIYICALSIVGLGAIGAWDCVTAPVEAGHAGVTNTPATFAVLPTPFPGRTRVTILLIGADDRKGEQGRSDTMILLFINPRNHQVAMLSVPRDLKVRIPGYGSTKINASYAYGGVELARKTIEEVFGVDIDYCAKADFQGFVEIVDMLGGVDLEVPDVEGKGRGMNYDDNWDNLHIHLKPGFQHLDGQQAIGFVRYRKSNIRGLGDGDFGRSQRQQQFLKAMVQQKLKITNVLQLAAVAPRILKWVQTDMSAREAAELALVIKDIKPENLLQASLQPYLRDYRTDDAWYVLCSESSIRRVLREIDEHLRSTPDARSVVVILNGSGQVGAAGAAGALLEREGFEVADTGNADKFDYSRTIIRHPAGRRAYAQAIRRTLGVGRLEESETPEEDTGRSARQEKITVIIGRDFDPHSAHTGT
ncbi:MAG: LCP family protein [Armatimonadetes bacterium]|nr:LCP family protein [Armatimonadota bacterium]